MNAPLSLSQPSAKGSLSLFRVFGPGRVNLGTFGKRHQAIAAMTSHNSKLKPGERPAWVGPGPDHWRSKPENAYENVIPERGDDYIWHPFRDSEPVREAIKPDEWLDWYTSLKEEAYA